MKKTSIIICFVILFVSKSFAQPSIRLSQVSWDIGEVKEGTVIKKNIIISNVGSQLLEVNSRAGCSCITFNKSFKKIAPGKEAILTIIFNTKGKQGNITEYIYFDTNDSEFPYITFIAEATVIGKYVSKKAQEEQVLSQDIAEGSISILMFSSPGCTTCRKLKEKYLPKLAEKYDIDIEIEHLKIDRKANYEKLIALENSLNDKNNKLPAILIGDRILGGEKEIKKEIVHIFKSIKKIGYKKLFEEDIKITKGNIQEKFGYIRLLPIIGAGLLDGINPCAFATIIFFISYLAFTGRGGIEILSTGISFTFAIFLSYTLIGLGAIKIIEKVTEFLPYVSLIIKIITVMMVFILGILSIYDWIKCKQGKLKEMKLQLSPLLKEKIHKSIVNKRKDFLKKDSRVFKLVLAGFSVGVLVSIFEFACTGQIYLPTIIYMLKIPEYRFSAIGCLLLYNLMFVVPLIVIFILCWKGVTSEQFTDIMLKHLCKIKIGMAIFFIGIGILLLYS